MIHQGDNASKMSENGDDVNNKAATLKVETALINDIDLDHIETLKPARSCSFGDEEQIPAKNLRHGIGMGPPE